MAVATSDFAMLVAEVANRLRMVQADALSEKERQAFFGDIIERALSSIAPGQRSAFLEALQAQFPAWNGQTQPAPPAADKSPDDRADPPDDPRQLLAGLVKLVPTLSPRDREYAAAALQQAGLQLGGGGAAAGLPDEVEKWFRGVFKFPPNQRVDPARVLALVPAMLELTCGLHQLVWTAWRTLAPNSELRPGLVNMQAAAVRNIANEPGATNEQVSKELTRLRQLTAALVAAVGETGRQFATNHCAKFSPGEIEAVVKMEVRGGIFGGPSDKDYWKKYTELFGELGEEKVEGEIRETIARHVELLMKGLVR